MARVVVVGAGVAGLGTALFAARDGHDVVLIERDDTPMPADPRDAFNWNRRGAPQVRHSHAFLARLRNLLRDRHPDVLSRLLAAGATEMDFIEMLPEGMDHTRQPGDSELVALACRRTTFEWVLRSVAVGEQAVDFRHGAGVTGLRVDGSDVAGSDADGSAIAGPEGAGSGSVPRVVGVELEDGSVVDGDMVVLAGGRRMSVPSLLSPIGVTIPEEVEDTGIVYLSRFFVLADGKDYPAQVGPVGGDLGYLKYAVFSGDNRTFSVTFAVGTDDTQLRRQLVDPEAFIRVAAALPATQAFVEPGRAHAMTEVEVMGGLLNRRYTYLDADGAPLVLGLHGVGDAHTCTNPLYGRGCSLGMVQAQSLVDTISELGLDHAERSRAYEAASDAEITPWYRASVAQDRMSRQAAASAAGTADQIPEVADPAPIVGTNGNEASETAADVTSAEFMRSLLRDGLFPAMRVDPVVLRAFLRMFNLLEPPDSLMTNMEVIGRVMTVYQDRENRAPEPSLGPDREGLIAQAALA